MKPHLTIILFMLLGVTNGCWKKSEKTAPAKAPTPVKEEQKVSITQNSNAGKSRSSGGSQGKTQKNRVETSELKKFSEVLYGLDSHNSGSKIILDYQGKTTSSVKDDVASRPLFPIVDKKLVEGNTFTAFKKLLDNYVSDVRKQEDNSPSEMSEIDSFLDTIMGTPVMKKTEEFLKKKELIHGSLRSELKTIWFTPYSRSPGTVGSSGFEHVFLGEIKSGKVTGFHNWIFFEKEEKEKDVNYKGFLKIIDMGSKFDLVKIRFDWMNRQKNLGSMFVGTSPEFEMALYTLCFYTRPNAGCSLQMNQRRFRIKVYVQNYGRKRLVGSAYPEVY